jgi:hypothetical protein
MEKKLLIIVSIFINLITMSIQDSQGASTPSSSPTSSDSTTDVCAATGASVAPDPAPTPLSSVTLPCLKPNQLTQIRVDLQPCATVLGTILPGQDHFSPGGLAQAFMDKMRQDTICYYKGYIPVSPTADVTKPLKTCEEGIPLAGATWKLMPVCSLNDGEDTKNHLNQACGTPSDRTGRWEQAQLRGIRVQAVKYYTHQVISDEIMLKGMLKVSEKCQPLAKDYYELLSKAEKLSACAMSGAPAAPPDFYKGGKDFCQTLSSPNPAQSASQSDDPYTKWYSEIPKGSVCYLSIARDHLVLAFLNLAQCEIWERVQDREYQSVANQAAIYNSYMASCLDDAYSHGEHVGHEELSESAGERAGNRRFDECYHSRMHKFILDIVKLIPGHFE